MGSRGQDSGRSKSYESLTWQRVQELRQKVGQDNLELGLEGIYVRTGHSFTLNNYLRRLARGEINAIPSAEANEINRFSTAFKKSPVAFNSVRYIGRDWMEDVFGTRDVNEAARIINTTKGLGFTEHGFMSASINSNANIFTGRAVELRLRTPKGASVLFTDNEGEGEIVHNKDTRVKFTSANVVGNRIVIEGEVEKWR